MAFEAREQFRILFLDKKNALIADEVQQVGTVDHPTGDPTPSQADSTMTRKIIAVAKAMGIVVHDHIIVGRDGHASFKGYRLMLGRVMRPNSHWPRSGWGFMMPAKSEG